CSVQFSTKRVVIAVLAMIRFGMRVGGGAHMLKIGFSQRRLVRRPWMLGCTAGGKGNKGEEGRQKELGELSKLSLGQGGMLARVINSYSHPGKNFLKAKLEARTPSTALGFFFLIQFTASSFLRNSTFALRRV